MHKLHVRRTLTLYIHSSVQSQLRKHYVGTNIPNAQSISVRIAPDPQLAVCKGLVSDRVRKLLTSRSVLGWRCCRASYGTLCKIAYDKKNPDHEGKGLVRDPLNGKMYIVQSIAWFVRKGEPVSVDQPIVHRFIKKVSPGDPRRAFPTSVVECSLESGRLPEQMNESKYPRPSHQFARKRKRLTKASDTRFLCEISSDLSSADEKKFIEKNKNFWSMKKHYFRIEYSVRVLIGPADIRFELWFDDQKLSRDQSIKVEWTPTPAPTMPSEPIELPIRRQTAKDGGPIAMSEARGKPGQPVGQEVSPDRTEKMKRGMGGFLAKARGGKWTVQR